MFFLIHGKLTFYGVMPRDKKYFVRLNIDYTVGYVLLNPCPANPDLSFSKKKTVDPYQLPFDKTI